MSNNDLKKLLINIETKALNSKNNDELLSAVKLAVDYGKPIEFDSKIPILFLVVGSILAASSLSLFLFNTNIYFDNPYVISVFVFSMVVISTSAFFLFSNKSLIDNLSDYISKKDTFQDNRIENLKTTNNGFVGSENIKNEFQEFSRGNHSREITQAALIKKESLLTEKQCSLYKFHYVDSYTVVVPTTSTDAKGNVTTGTRVETRYNHYDRYGIVYDFLLAKNIKILSDKTPSNSVDYNSASIKFSENFNIGADSEMDASSFLKPKVVEVILHITTIIHGLNIEINNSGVMCLSWDDDNLFNAKANYDLTQPELFYKELSGHTDLEKLTMILACIVGLEKQLDNNFKEDK